MHVLPEAFNLFKMCGFWCPVEYDTWKRILYFIYTATMAVLINSFVISEVIEIILNHNDVDEVIEITYVLLNKLSALCKISVILGRRGKIISLLKMLLVEQCRPRDSEELRIQKNYDDTARFVVLFYGSFCLTGASLMVLGPLFEISNNRILPFKAWLPYDPQSSTLFVISYVHQGVAVICSALMGVATESFVAGLLLQTCAQLEILQHRLQRLSDSFEGQNSGSTPLTKCIYHHIYIFKFADTIQAIFSPVVFVQFCASSMVIGMSVYQLTKEEISRSEFSSTAIYLFCMMVQILLYCWFGNEMTIQSINVGDAAYKMDWMLLDNAARKDILMLKKRCMIPIKFVSGSLFTVSIEAFIAILKVTYSSYNLLQQTADNTKPRLNN